jgi:hypothetical protein
MSKRRALLIGVPEYNSELISNLGFIPADMERLHGALHKSGYRIKQVGVGDTLAPTQGNLRSEIHKFCSSAAAGETLLICFSGHGLHWEGRDFMVPQDASTEDDDIQSYLVPIDLHKIFERSRAGAILFFVDACREGVKLGTQGEITLRRWSSGEIQQAQKRSLAFIFACGEGEVSRYVPGTGGFSLFSRALADTLSPEDPAVTFSEIIESLQDRLNALADASGKPRQTVRVRQETGVADGALEMLQICEGTRMDALDQIDADPWIRAALQCPLWEEVEGVDAPSVANFKRCVARLVSACRQQWKAAIQALPDDPWRDEGLPERTLNRLVFLAEQCDALDLGGGEVALLVSVPFIREGILSAAAGQYAKADPLDLEATGVTSGPRAALEKTYSSVPHIVRRALRLENKDCVAEHDAIAFWLMHRSILREPEVWNGSSRNSPPEDPFLRQLAAASQDGSPAVRETFSVARLVELARCIHADPERIERAQRPGAIQPEVFVAASSPGEQMIRERVLAYLLALAGRMAIDSRGLTDVIIEHVGLSDPLVPSEAVAAVSQSTWVQSPHGRSLRVVCPHPALDLALHEHVQHTSQLMEFVQRKIYRKEDHAGALEGLPLRLSAGDIEPQKSDQGTPAYETPHLQFRLSHNEIRELLMGVQLYGDPLLAVRELYQNALDACRYRLARITYLKRTGRYKGGEWQGRIVFRQGVEGGRAYIECEDNGIGMGRRELTDAFSRAGRRFSDMPEFIEEQAEWLRCDPPVRLYPNSQFGVGVYSYFMLADELHIETCRLNPDGRTGARLEVQIPGSGSLFRVRPLEGGADAGTRIRLYLSDEALGSDGEGGHPSCRATLRELLWVPQFRVEVQEDGTVEVWEPNRLSDRAVPASGSALRASGLDLWWVKQQKEEPAGREEPLLGSILADGLATDRKLPLAIVDLNQSHRPKLTVDRKEVVEWDEAYVADLLLQGVRKLAEEPSWLTYSWLWSLQGWDPHLTDALVTSLLDHDPAVALPVRAKSHTSIPLRELGCFPPDKILLAPVNEETFQARLQDRDHAHLKQRISPLLLPFRAALLGRYGLPVPQWLLGAANLSASLDRVPVPRPGDDVALSPGSSLPFQWIGEQVSPLALLNASVRLGEPVREVFKRLERFAPLGLVLPVLGADELNDLSVEQEDLVLLSRDLDGREPWLETVSIFHLLRASAQTGQPVGAILARLERFAPLGLEFLYVDRVLLRELTVSSEDLDLLPEDLDDLLHSGVQLSLPDLLYAALDIGESVGAVLERLERFEALGLELPPGDSDELSDLYIEREDIVVLSENLDGEEPWIETVSPFHLLRAVLNKMEPPKDVLQRLERFAPLGIVLPSLGADELSDLSVEQEDRVLLSRDLDGREPWIGTVSPFHLLRASAQTRQPVGAILARLERFAPLGLKLPSADHALLGELLITSEEIDLLPEELDDLLSSVDKLPVIDLLYAALNLDEPVEAVLERLERFAPLGLTLPPMDPAQLANLTLQPEDRVLLSQELNGRPPWILDVSPLHLLRAALRIAKPVGAVLERLERFAAIGLDLPSVDRDRLKEFIVRPEDIVLFSEDLDGRAPWVPEISPIQLLRAASKTGEPLRKIAERLDRLSPLGVDLSEYGLAKLGDRVVDKIDLLLTFPEPDGTELISLAYVFDVAEQNGLRPAEVLARLQNLSPLVGLVPEVSPDLIDGSYPSLEELVVLSRDRDGMPPWLDDLPSPGHVLRAARKIGSSIGTVIGLLRRGLPPCPGIDAENAERFAARKVSDADLVSVPTWLSGEVSPMHILGTSFRLREPVGTTLRRFQELESLGLRVTAADPEDFADTWVTRTEAVVLSTYLDAREPWAAEVSNAHVAEAAYRLRLSEEEILAGLRRFEPLGLKVIDEEAPDPGTSE